MVAHLVLLLSLLGHVTSEGPTQTQGDALLEGVRSSLENLSAMVIKIAEDHDILLRTLETLEQHVEIMRGNQDKMYTKLEGIQQRQEDIEMEIRKKLDGIQQRQDDKAVEIRTKLDDILQKQENMTMEMVEANKNSQLDLLRNLTDTKFSVPDNSHQGEGVCGEANLTYDALNPEGNKLYSPGMKENLEGSYINNLDCTWTIHLPETELMELTFHVFDVESEASDGSCEYDALTLENEQGDILSRQCGNKAPDVIHYRGSKLSVNFKTDATVVKKGFVLEFFDLGPCGVTNITYDRSNADSNKLYSPGLYGNLGGSYSNNLNCTWTIHFPLNQTMLLRFTSLSIQYHDTCQYDAVVLRGAYGHLVSRKCGSEIPDPIYYEGSQLSVTFTTDDSIVKTGFVLEYEVAEPGCYKKTVLADSQGSIISPGYREDNRGHYGDYRFCTWEIQPPVGYGILGKFVTFEIELGIQCRDDSLSVSTNGEVLHKLCGKNLPPMLNITINEPITLTLTSDDFLSFNGFWLNYGVHEACLGAPVPLNGEEEGFITSPGWEEDIPVPENIECSWFMTGPRWKTMNLRLDEIRPTDGNACDFLTVYDGPSPSSPVLGPHCEGPPPGLIKGSSHQLLLVMRTGSHIQAGFRARYKSVK